MVECVKWVFGVVAETGEIEQSVSQLFTYYYYSTCTRNIGAGPIIAGDADDTLVGMDRSRKRQE
jgi:hypothetical protein